MVCSLCSPHSCLVVRDSSCWQACRQGRLLYGPRSTHPCAQLRATAAIGLCLITAPTGLVLVWMFAGATPTPSTSVDFQQSNNLLVPSASLFVRLPAGYQMLVGVFFLLCLPVNILFNTAAVSTAAVVTMNRQAALSDRGVPTASFTGQGRGKVGLADYPRPPGSCRSSYDECDISPLSSISSSSSEDSIATSSSSTQQSPRRGVGVVGFRGGFGAAGFSVDTAAHSTASSSSIPTEQVSQQQQQQQEASSSAAASTLPPSSSVTQPAPAPALPWLTVVQERTKPPPLLGLKASLAAVQEAWSNQVACRIRGLWRVDVLFNLWALPLQAASLAVLPVFWTFPRLLGIQLALPVAVLGGARGNKALEESRALMAGFKSSYAWPFVWLIAAGRLLEVVREVVLLSMPNRWWTDVPEVPLVATAVFFAARVLLLRVQDLLPLAAYLLLVRQPKVPAVAGEGESKSSTNNAIRQ